MHGTIFEVAFSKADLTFDNLSILDNACERGEIDYYTEKSDLFDACQKYFAKIGLTANLEEKTITVSDKYDLEVVYDIWCDNLKELLDCRVYNVDFWKIRQAVNPLCGLKFIYNDELIDEIEFIIELCKCEQGTKVYVGGVYDYHV